MIPPYAGEKANWVRENKEQQMNKMRKARDIYKIRCEGAETQTREGND